MASIAYQLTRDGVYVQTHCYKPSDEDWAEMLGYVRAHGAEIRAVLVDGRNDATPSPRQRQLLAREIGALSTEVKFALLIDSRFSRGALLALSWVTGRGDRMQAFSHARREEALDFLELSGDAKIRAKEALAQQSDCTTSQAV